MAQRRAYSIDDYMPGYWLQVRLVDLYAADIARAAKRGESSQNPSSKETSLNSSEIVGERDQDPTPT